METAIRLIAGAALPFVLLWLGLLLRTPAVNRKSRALMWTALGIAILLALASVIAGIMEDQKARAGQAAEQAKRERIEADVKRLAPLIGKQIEAADSIEYRMRSDFAPKNLKEYVAAINGWRDRVDGFLCKELPNSGATDRFKIERGQPGQRPLVWEYNRLVTLRGNLGAVLERLDFYVAHRSGDCSGAR